MAERIRKKVGGTFAEEEAIAVSVGVATCPEHGRDAETLIGAADKALYASKRAGRNRTSVFDPAQMV